MAYTINGTQFSLAKFGQNTSNTSGLLWPNVLTDPNKGVVSFFVSFSGTSSPADFASLAKALTIVFANSSATVGSIVGYNLTAAARASFTVATSNMPAVNSTLTASFSSFPPGYNLLSPSINFQGNSYFTLAANGASACTGGRDYSRCGLDYTELISLNWCPIYHPVRAPPLLQLPLSPFRPSLPSNVSQMLPLSSPVDERDKPPGSDSEQEALGNLTTWTVPFTGANLTFAQQLMSNTIGAPAALKSLLKFTTNLTTLNTLVMQFTKETGAMNRSSAAWASPLGGSNIFVQARSNLEVVV